MSIELFGEFRTLTGIVGFVSAFALMGTGQAVLMSASKNADGNYSALLRSKLKANCWASLVLSGAALYHLWSPSGSAAIGLGLLAVAAIFPIYNTSDFWMAWLNGKSRFLELALGRSLISALGIAAVAAVALTSVTQLWVVCLVYFGFAAAQSGWALLRTSRQRANDTKDVSIPAFGVHSSIAMAFSGLLSLDVVVLNHLFSAQDVAIYAVALQFPELLKRLFSVMDSIISPKIYAAVDFKSIWPEIKGAFLTVTVGCVAIGIVGFFLLPPLTVLLFSERYADAAEFGRWLWLAVACCGSTTLLAPALLSTQKPFFVYAPYIGYPLFQAVLFASLVSNGIGGLTLARIVGVLVLSAFYVGGFVYCLRGSGVKVVRAL
ncbi:MAG: hypothetical protein Q8M24_08925 [Pseudolabrys sp.]|nr:hypothetical protein [Pseudolabrys sp.]MDP2295570.1 hypothetical protein [Pseudolabrys sp.]